MPTLAFDPEETTRWEDIRPRHVSPEQWQKFEVYASEIFTAFGMDLKTPGTRATPTRFLRALYDATSGYEGDPKLLTAFPTECRGGPDCSIAQVIEGPIEFFSLCEHHALPFHGHAYIGYIAHEEIIGISKLTRLVRVFARRFTVQERVGVEIAGAGACAPAPRCGGVPQRHAPLHADARCSRRALAHAHLVLAREL